MASGRARETSMGRDRITLSFWNIDRFATHNFVESRVLPRRPHARREKKTWTWVGIVRAHHALTSRKRDARGCERTRLRRVELAREAKSQRVFRVAGISAPAAREAGLLEAIGEVRTAKDAS